MITAPTAGSRSAASASEHRAPCRAARVAAASCTSTTWAIVCLAAGGQIGGMDGPDPAGTELREDEHGVPSKGRL